MPTPIIIDISEALTSPPDTNEDVLSIFELFSAHTIVMPQHRMDNWRLTDRETGDILGQPYLGTCTIVATDGVHAFVETPAFKTLKSLDGRQSKLFKIHVTNFQGKVQPRGTNARAKAYKPKRDADQIKQQMTKVDKASAKADALLEEMFA